MAQLLSVNSLVLSRYKRAVVIFLVGLVLSLGVAIRRDPADRLDHQREREDLGQNPLPWNRSFAPVFCLLALSFETAPPEHAPMGSPPHPRPRRRPFGQEPPCRGAGGGDAAPSRPGPMSRRRASSTTRCATASPLHRRGATRAGGRSRRRSTWRRRWRAPKGPVLVDCLTLWLTNVMLAGDDIEAATDRPRARPRRAARRRRPGLERGRPRHRAGQRARAALPRRAGPAQPAHGGARPAASSSWWPACRWR